MIYASWNEFCMIRVLWHLTDGFSREVWSLTHPSDRDPSWKLSPPPENYETYYRSARVQLSYKFWTILNYIELFSLGLFRSILVFLGLSLSILACLWLYQAISGYLRQYQAVSCCISVYHGVSWSILVYPGPSGLSLSISAYLGFSLVIAGYILLCQEISSISG